MPVPMPMPMPMPPSAKASARPRPKARARARAPALVSLAHAHGQRAEEQGLVVPGRGARVVPAGEAATQAADLVLVGQAYVHV